MKSSRYMLFALWLGVVGNAEAAALSIVSIQAVGPVGTQNSSGPTSASIFLSGGGTHGGINQIEASIAGVRGSVEADDASFIFDVIQVSTQVTVSDPAFPDCVVLCPFQVGANLVLNLDGFALGGAGVTASAHGSNGFNGTGVIIPFAFDTTNGGGPNAVVDPLNQHSVAIRFLPLGTYFLDLQVTVSAQLGAVDFTHSFHPFIVPLDGVTVTEVTGLMPIGPLVSGVPEPETYAMLLAGLGLLGFAARRRKRQAA